MRPRARLIALIGEELISDEPVAVVELVKNSYDADATKVDVRFEGEAPERPTRIVVEDDGCGMSLRTVLRAWLEPATNSKRTTDLSPRGQALPWSERDRPFCRSTARKSIAAGDKTQQRQARRHRGYRLGGFRQAKVL